MIVGKRRDFWWFSSQSSVVALEDATFGASKVFGGAYFREQFLERWPGVWSLKWCCRHLPVGSIFTSSVNVCLEKRRGGVRVMYVMGMC